MPLRPHTREVLRLHVRTHWKNGCPMCANPTDPKWRVLGSSFVEVSDESSKDWKGVLVPTLALACKRCGFVASVTLDALGLGEE